jgi:CRISPR-associated protein Csc1
MTYIYRCELELHDYLYFATREIGRLYETEAVLHNYALCYALGLIDNPQYKTTIDNPDDEYRYFCRYQVPKYRCHLSRLNDVGIYITPAIALRHATALHTWKYADNCYHVEMKKTQKNIPSFGRAKEIAPGSRFEFFMLTEKEINSKQLPKWIRLGKWMSKARINVNEVEFKAIDKEFTCTLPLNPLDVMASHQIQSFDTINMPPVSLIRNVRAQGRAFQLVGDYSTSVLPARMKFTFPSDA